MTRESSVRRLGKLNRSRISLEGVLAVLSGCLLIGIAPLASRADVYWWKPGNDADKRWDDLSNWATTSAARGENPADTAVDAVRMPGVADSLWVYQHSAFDLNGGNWTVGSYVNEGDWNKYSMRFRNGRLTFVNKLVGKFNFFHFDAGATVVIDSGCAFTLGETSGGTDGFNVNAGGALEIYGAVEFWNGSITVADGGELTYAAESTTMGSSYMPGNQIVNSGLANFPQGLTMTPSGGAAAVFTIEQRAGTMTAGGPFAGFARSASQGSVAFVLSGGTLKATGDVSFSNVQRLSVPVDAIVSLEAESGASLDLSGFAFGANASLSKTGEGRLLIDNLPDSLSVLEGTLVLSRQTTSLDGVRLGDGVTLAFSCGGNDLAEIPNASGIRFTVTDDFPVEMVVLRSPDAALRATVVANFVLPAALAGEYVARTSGDSVILVSTTENQFVSDGEVDLNTPDAWTGGLVPSAAVLTGGGTVGVLSDETSAFSSIAVKGGATLKITAAQTDLPSILLDKDARLMLTGGCWASLSNGLTCVATEDLLPVFEIATNATLAVPGATEFNNVDLRFHGTIDVQAGPDSSHHYVGFGCANGGVTYFAMTSVGGRLHHATACDYGQRFVFAQNGGRVKVRRPILLRDYVHDMDDSFQANGPWIGWNNPTNEYFEMTVDHSTMEVSRSCGWGGGGRVKFVNGACLRPLATHPGVAASILINGALQIVFESGSGILYQHLAGRMSVDPGYDGWPTVLLSEGGWLDAHELEGNGKAVLVASNGVWCVDALPVIPYDKIPYPQDGDPRNWTTDPFAGFARVETQSGADVFLASADKLGMSVQQDRCVRLADVPITGAGGLCVTNGVPDYAFAVTLVSGANTATGRLRVADSGPGKPTTLFLNDGANWAGVLEGDEHIAFTNLVDSAAPAEVDIASLELVGDLHVRYWRTSEGVANDMLNLMTTLSGVGKIRPVAMSGKLHDGESFVLGRYPASVGLPDPGLLDKGWCFETRQTNDGSEDVLLCCRRVTGGLIIQVR